MSKSKSLYLVIVSLFMISCEDEINHSDSQNDTLSLTLNSEFANESNANVIPCGIFAIWWDKNFDHNHLFESEKITCEYLKEVREISLNQLNMFDPPNLDAGYYVNIYIHHDNVYFHQLEME